MEAAAPFRDRSSPLLPLHAEDTRPDSDSEGSEDLDSEDAEAREGVGDADEGAADAGARVKEEAPLP